MKIEDLISDLDVIVGLLNSDSVDVVGWLTLSNSAYEIRKILERQITIPATIKHEVGDEVVLIICPSCERSIIADLTKHSEFNKSWHCKDCGQCLTLEDDESEDFDFDVLDFPNCCDCEWTYNGGECDNCEWK